MVLTCISLKADDIAYLFMSYHPSLQPLSEVSAEVFCPLLNWAVHLLTFEF